jgi:NTE family protein
MNGEPAATDMQTLFARNEARADFLQASKLEEGPGLCLSGGGYRAMIYHVGALTRLNELGILGKLQEIASVSGGSIAAGKLALAWPKLAFDVNGVASNFEELVAQPLLRFAKTTVDIKAILYGLLPGCSAADSVAAAYDKHLFGGASLQEIADVPRFTFMATNLQTGSGWRFAKAYAADYRVGQIDRPALSLARVVAASSAFPPLLSPVGIKFEKGTVRKTAGADLHREPFISKAVLCDGGVYDNLGLERVWKRCRTVLVSNAGKTVPEIGKPTGRWIGQFFRTLSLIQQQAENSRRRILFGMSNLGQRCVAYWSVDTPISSFGVLDAPHMPETAAAKAACMRTRLAPFTDGEIRLLLKAGYAGADASLRARGLALNQPLADFVRLPHA